MSLRCRLATIAVWGCLLPLAWAQSEGTEMQRLLSRLQSMGHGYYPASQWNTVLEDIHELIRGAEAAGDTRKMVDVTVILAEVYSGMLGQHARSLEVLTDLRTHLEGMPAAAAADHGMAKLYMKLAEVHSRLGDRSAIQQLIEEFRAGPFYDPQDYAVEGLSSPDDPVRIRRPYGRGEDSITVSTMNRYLQAAALAPGNTFPGFSGVAADARPVQIPPPDARMVLVDFWVPNWVAWRRDLPSLTSLYNRYRAQGFEIVGFHLAAPTAEAVTVFASENGMAWPQVVGERKFATRCGVAGEATNFLLDHSGRILARDIRGSDLAAVLRSTFGE